MYIPLNKIDPKIYYTNGGEYYYASNLTNYVGYYRKDTNGRSYAGKELTVNSPKLVPSFTVSNSPSPNINLGSGLSTTYFSISKNTKQQLLESFNPIPNSLPPTPQEYEQTFYVRYFLEYLLSSKPIIVEVNKGTYFTYVNSNLSKYFNNVEVLWKISGPLYDVKENGILMQGGVIDSNLRSIQQAQKQMPGIENYLTDLTLYYKFPNTSNLYTSGNEFKTVDGKNYIGYYHSHETTGFMVGKTHTKEFHEKLFPINETLQPTNPTNNLTNQTTGSYNSLSVGNTMQNFSSGPSSRGGGY